MDRFPFLSPEKLSFKVKSGRGHHLACVIDIPSHPRPNDGPLNVAILCHGLFGSKETKPLLTTSAALLYGANGLNKDSSVNVDYVEGVPNLVDAVVRFDFHGNGESDGFDDWSLGGYEAEAEDLRDIVKFLRGHNCKTIFVLGHSRAATSVLVYASKYGDIPLTVAAAGRLYLEKGLDSRLGDQIALLEKEETITMLDTDGRPRKVTPEDYRRRVSLDIESLLPRITEKDQVKGILILHADDDTIVPVEDAKRTYEVLLLAKNEGARAKNSVDLRLVILPGAGHSLGPKSTKTMQKCLRSFLEDNFDLINK